MADDAVRIASTHSVGRNFPPDQRARPDDASPAQYRPIQEDAIRPDPHIVLNEDSAL
jgi:hypothetical protein